MRKLLLVKRSDRIKQAPDDIIAATGLTRAVVVPGDVIYSFGELRVAKQLCAEMKRQTGLEYLFGFDRNVHTAAFLVPIEDVQEIDIDPRDMLAIIHILM